MSSLERTESMITSSILPLWSLLIIYFCSFSSVGFFYPTLPE